jgi:hypothetical protein
MVKSKLKKGFITWFITTTLGLVGVLVIIGMMVYILFEKIEFFPLFMAFWLSIMVLVVLVIYKDFKRILINEASQTLTYYSMYRPFGKSMALHQFKGYIVLEEYGAYETYKTLHLIDTSNTTVFKISGLFYSNFDELCQAIPLKHIKTKHLGFWKYVKLVCTGRIDITKL